MFSCNCRRTFVSVLRNFRIVNSPKFHGDRFPALAETSYDSRETDLRHILAKKFA